MCPSTFSYLVLHNWIWQAVVCMILKGNLIQIQNKSLFYHPLFYPAWRLVKARDSKLCAIWSISTGHASFDWPCSTTISQSHILLPQSPSSNRRNPLYGRLMVIEKKSE
ncbi:hypothetical protein GOODEAATRI_023201 [Goodea atripinnis]|uniref:Uncharacterized protein n=1 Tax=Goodea atripinnis TaxID=208336 RepID=A0ABV0PGA3_9TELE